MVLNIPSTILKFCSLGIVLTAAGIWTGAQVDTRPKNIDEQTLIGGAIWSQLLIPIGLIISLTADEELYTFVHAYYLIAGTILLSLTGILLIYEETKKLKKQRQSLPAVDTLQRLTSDSFDKIYFTIGVLSSVAAIITFADFIINVI